MPRIVEIRNCKKCGRESFYYNFEKESGSCGNCQYKEDNKVKEVCD